MKLGQEKEGALHTEDRQSHQKNSTERSEAEGIQGTPTSQEAPRGKKGKQRGSKRKHETDPVSLPVARALEVREGPTRETNAPSDATARSASEDDREEPAARAKPGDRGSPAKAELGERPWYKSSPPPSGISRLAPETEKPCRPRYRWSCQDTSQSARAQYPTSSRLSQSQECDKARTATGLPAWPLAPRSRGPTSHPDSGEVGSRESVPTLT